MADIGAEAGFSRGHVNHHFGSRATLVERLAEECQRHFFESLPPLDETDEIEALIAFSNAYLRVIDLADEEVRAFYVMWGAALPEDAPLRPIFVAVDRNVRRSVQEIVAKGKERKTITHEIDPGGFAAVFVGLLRGLGAQFLIDPDSLDFGSVHDMCEQFLRSALKPSQAFL